MKNLQCFTHSNSQTMNFKLIGVLSGMNAMDFKRNIESVVRFEEKDINLDLGGVNEIDLAGLNVIISMHSFLIKKGRRLELKMGEEHPIHELLHLTKFNNILSYSAAA